MSEELREATELDWLKWLDEDGSLDKLNREELVYVVRNLKDSLMRRERREELMDWVSILKGLAIWAALVVFTWAMLLYCISTIAGWLT